MNAVETKVFVKWPVACKANFDFRKVNVRCKMNQIKAKARAYFDRIRSDDRLWK